MGQPVQPKAKKPIKQSLADHAPWKPAPWELADVSAIQALLAGTADEYQQKRALKWIIEVACDTYGLPYRPGAQEGERDSTFAMGKQFVGQQIVKLTHLNLSKLRSSENVA